MPKFTSNEEIIDMNPLPENNVWNSESTERFLNSFKTNLIQSMYKKVEENTYICNTLGVEDLCNSVSSIYQKASLTIRKPNNRREN